MGTSKRRVWDEPEHIRQGGSGRGRAGLPHICDKNAKRERGGGCFEARKTMADVLRLLCCFEAREPLADVFSSETGAAGAPSRPLPKAEATVSTENTSPLARSLKKAGVG